MLRKATLAVLGLFFSMLIIVSLSQMGKHDSGTIQASHPNTESTATIEHASEQMRAAVERARSEAPESDLPREIPSSYRLYKLCEIQDDSCLPLLRQLFAGALAKRAQCANNNALTNDQMYWSFMQVTSATPGFLSNPAPALVMGVLNVAEPCVFKRSPPIYSTPKNMIPPSGSAPGY